ncbi:MAG TPA: hypothetical protein VJ743_22760, partial [Albitalea sp.]|nr:hypothetical protein [Albitalea sp.]
MARRFAVSGLAPIVVSAAAGWLLAGCGGGGTEAASAGPGASTTISGTLVKGPVSEATIRAFAVSGGAVGAAIASTTTDSAGAFVLVMGNYAGPVMLQASAGHFTDEATGTMMPMAASDLMSAVLPTVPAGSNISGIAVTPLTSMAQSMAAHMSGGLQDANITAANAALGSMFMVGDILRVSPMNPLVAGSGAAATPAARNYGMVLAGMSQYAKDIGMLTSSGIVTAMMSDASDGIMDGMAAGVQVGM